MDSSQVKFDQVCFANYKRIGGQTISQIEELHYTFILPPYLQGLFSINHLSFVPRLVARFTRSAFHHD